ncbi:MAG: hypothetical protein RIE59_27665, partial [Imperialibacter sp.]
GLLTSCEKPIIEFQLIADGQHRTLTLYRDSTFVEQIRDTVDVHTYSGTWAGDIQEGTTFETLATSRDGEIITMTPMHKYRIAKGRAVEVVISGQ